MRGEPRPVAREDVREEERVEECLTAERAHPSEADRVDQGAPIDELLGERVLTTPSHTAYLKISEGCDNPCSFCTIPLARGASRSQEMGETLRQARHQVLVVIVADADGGDGNALARKVSAEFAQFTRRARTDVCQAVGQQHDAVDAFGGKIFAQLIGAAEMIEMRVRDEEGRLS